MQEILTTAIIFSTLDTVIRYCFKLKHQIPYFLLHSIFNSYIVYRLYKSVIHIETMTQSYDTQISLLVMGFHVYHILCYFTNLTSEDWIHHIATFVQTYILFVYDLKAPGEIGVFFLCGLPGIFYYLPLFLYKIQAISKKLQKKINFYANYLRVFGIVYATTLGIVLYQSNHFQVPLFVLLITIITINFNTFYFQTAVIADYYRSS